MNKHDKLIKKKFQRVGSFNSSVVNATYVKIIKIYKVKWAYIHANFDTIAGKNFISNVYAKGKIAEKRFWNAKNTDGRTI